MYKGIVENRSYNDMIEAGFYKIQNKHLNQGNCFIKSICHMKRPHHCLSIFLDIIKNSLILWILLIQTSDKLKLNGIVDTSKKLVSILILKYFHKSKVDTIVLFKTIFHLEITTII